MKSLVESILSSTKSGKSELLWNEYVEYLSNLKTDYHYRGVTRGTTYLPGIKEKVNIDKVFLFDINRRRELRNDKAIKKYAPPKFFSLQSKTQIVRNKALYLL